MYYHLCIIDKFSPKQSNQQSINVGQEFWGILEQSNVFGDSIYVLRCGFSVCILPLQLQLCCYRQMFSPTTTLIYNG